MIENIAEVKKKLLTRISEELEKVTNPQDFYVYSVVLNMLEPRREFDPSETYTKMIDGLLALKKQEEKDDNVSKVD